MTTKGINTAVPKQPGSEIDGLNEDQLRAVRKLRKLAEAQKVSTYTIGAFCARSAHLNRLADAKRLLALSPASRETKIAEWREELEPYEPLVVSAWSAWCVQNNVDPFAAVQQVEPIGAEHDAARGIAQAPERDLLGKIQAAVERYKSALPSEPQPEGPGAAALKSTRAPQATGSIALAEQLIRDHLADGKEHSSRKILNHATGLGISETSIGTARKRLGVIVRRERGEKHGGTRTYWHLPSATGAPLVIDIPERVPMRQLKQKPGYVKGMAKWKHGSRARAKEIIREMLADGQEHAFTEIRDRVVAAGISLGTLDNASFELQIEKRRARTGHSYWKLSGEAVVPDEKPTEPKPKRSYELDSYSLAVMVIAEREGVSVTTLVRWAEMEIAPNGSMYGKKVLPDRESDVGIELADEVFQASGPRSPRGIEKSVLYKRARTPVTA